MPTVQGFRDENAGAAVESEASVLDSSYSLFHKKTPIICADASEWQGFTFTST